MKWDKISDKEMICHLVLKFPDMGLLPSSRQTVFFYGGLVMENQLISPKF